MGTILVSPAFILEAECVLQPSEQKIVPTSTPYKGITKFPSGGMDYLFR